MSNAITISVDGENGSVVSRNPGIRLVGGGADLALVRYDDNGSHGQNAAPANRGGPAGFTAFELWESETVLEGINAQLLENNSRQRPPTSVEVPPKRDVLFTAIGGTGEDGKIGGDGQPGMDGVDGRPATREVDATPGTNGGNGGDAGRGTNGADGGDGGIVEIHVDEENTHLLLAVNWDVSGGLGGTPGHHGNPGRGGRGGHGGQGHTWEELVGYRYDCTDRCLGQTNTSKSQSIVRAGSRVGSGTMALVAPMRRQIVQGGNLQAVIAQAAVRWGAVRQPRQNLNTARCKCAGAPSNVSCIGCDPVPIHTRFDRSAGLGGRDGRPGASITTPLIPGAKGREGTATIVVRMRDGGRQEYTAKYILELIDFDIEDENGDGIFEPGEHIYIRRVRVRNNGGMPSPICRIPITVRPSRWLIPTEDRAMIPSSIPAGESVTLDDPIRVLIRASADPPPPGSLFLQQDTMSVTAHMPWLNRELPHFEYSRHVNIQYPVELRQFDFLKSMAQGSTSRFAFELYNKGSVGIGSASPSARTLEICSSFPADCGDLLSMPNEWVNEVTQDVPNVASTSVAPLSQTIRIERDAENYRHVDIWMGVYLEEPIHPNEDGVELEVGKNLIQQVNLRIQISSLYNYQPQSSFLIVTNSKTTRSRMQAIQNFINNNLEKQSDIWNICLYGGLELPVEDGKDSSENVISSYHGKSIIFLGTRQEVGDRDFTELCDPRVMAKASAQNTAFLFLGSSGHPALQKLLERVVFPMPYSATCLARSLSDSSKFKSKEDLIESIKQSKLFSDSAIHAYTVPIERRWYRLGKGSPRSDSADLARRLRHQFPQERFLVAPITETVGTSDALQGDCPQDETLQSQRTTRLAILHGLPHKVSVIATEKRTATFHHLDSFERFMIVRTLPVLRRIETLWTAPATGPIHAEDDHLISTFKYLHLSLLTEINLEIYTFLHKSPWCNKLTSSTSPQETTCFLQTHLPTLSKLLHQTSAINSSTPPEPVISLLQHAYASTLPQKKRHLIRGTFFPLLHRRTHLRHILHTTLTSFLATKTYDKRAITTFFTTSKSLHSHFDASKRNTGNVILRQVSEATRRSVHQYEMGHKTASTFVKGSMYCSEAEWGERWRGVEEQLGERWRGVEEQLGRIREEMRRARGELERMILDVVEVGEAEMEG